MNQEQIIWQVVAGVIIPFVLQWLKGRSWFPFLNQWSSTGWKVTLSVITAVFTALGLSYAFDPVVGRLVIDGLTFANMGQALLAFLLSIGTQQATYSIPGIGAKALVSVPVEEEVPHG